MSSHSLFIANFVSKLHALATLTFDLLASVCDTSYNTCSSELGFIISRFSNQLKLK